MPENCLRYKLKGRNLNLRRRDILRYQFAKVLMMAKRNANKTSRRIAKAVGYKY